MVRTVAASASRRLRLLWIGMAFLATLVFAGFYAGRTEAQSGDPIGILLAAGDIAGCHQSTDKHAEMAAQIQKEIDAAGSLPVGILVLGDVAYAARVDEKVVPGTYQPCFESFKASWGAHKERLFPVPGNHDYSDDIPAGKPAKKTNVRARMYKEFFSDRILDLKKASGNPVDPADKGLSFATRFPAGQSDGWLLVGMNFYGSEIEPKPWLAKQLAAPAPRCALVFTHPFYASSGDHGGGKNYDKMARLMPVLHQQGATVLVSGHDHVLEQFVKLDGTGKPDAAKGVRSFVVGTGGANLYPEFTKHPHSEYFSNKSRGFLKLTLYRDGYKWSFVAVDGPKVDLPVGGETCNRKPPA
jgi:hypothetical protein